MSLKIVSYFGQLGTGSNGDLLEEVLLPGQKMNVDERPQHCEALKLEESAAFA